MKKSSLILALSLAIITVTSAQVDSRYIEASDFVEIVKLPRTSWIYPDTFAVYWKLPRTSQHTGKASIKFRYSTIFSEYPFEFEYTRDSIVTMILDNNYRFEPGMILERTMVAGGKTIYDISEAMKILKIIQKDSEIETIRSLSDVSYSFENLKMLADVYEKKECFANAYFVYTKLMALDVDRGRNEFYAFFRRNSKKLNPKINTALR